MLTPTMALHWGLKMTRNKLRRRIFFFYYEKELKTHERTQAQRVLRVASLLKRRFLQGVTLLIPASLQMYFTDNSSLFVTCCKRKQNVFGSQVYEICIKIREIKNKL